MNTKLFKSGFVIIASLLLASCAHRHAKTEAAPASTPAAEVSTPKTEAPAAATAPEKVKIPTAAETLDADGPRIELKPSEKKMKAIEITNAQRAVPDAATPESATASATAAAKESVAETDSAPAAHSGAAAAADAAAGSGSAVEVAGVEPNQALRWLQNGNKRFVKGWLRKDGQSLKDVQRLAKSQRPHTIILSCSDSRVPPEIVFDQKLGEVFVIRTAGEALDANVIASIEYAVAHLGTRLLLVMGHTSCGAVKLAVQTLNGSDGGSASLNHVAAILHPYIREMLANAKHSKGYEREGWAVASGVAADLVNKSEILKAAVQKGQLLVKTALYHLDSGVVDFE